MTSKQAETTNGAQPAITYYVLALDHTPGIVVLATHDKDAAIEVRDDYERVHNVKATVAVSVSKL